MTALINQLIRDASAKDAAERDLRALSERIETFNVELPINPAYNEQAVSQILNVDAAFLIGRMIVDHPRAVKRTDRDGFRRFTVRIVLEPEE